jgi:hypothetical protein
LGPLNGSNSATRALPVPIGSPGIGVIGAGSEVIGGGAASGAVACGAGRASGTLATGRCVGVQPDMTAASATTPTVVAKRRTSEREQKKKDMVMLSENAVGRREIGLSTGADRLSAPSGDVNVAVRGRRR